MPKTSRAVARLAVRQKPVTAPPAATHPEVQAAALADAAGLSHPASDEPIPDVESAFFDLRDPMVDSTGYRPTHTQVLRMKSGFAAASLLLSFAMSRSPWCLCRCDSTNSAALSTAP